MARANLLACREREYGPEAGKWFAEKHRRRYDQLGPRMHGGVVQNRGEGGGYGLADAIILL